MSGASEPAVITDAAFGGLARAGACGNAPLVSIVIPVLNEVAGLAALLTRLERMATRAACRFEFVFVNDGSSDGTLAELQRRRLGDPRIGIVNLSRRFGKEYAVSAGLQHASGDAVVLIDADLQDPPECIPEMVAAWADGYDMVAMRRADRAVDSWFKRSSARAF
ncbi:MAG: glycosyltransferase family 2 protein, partial [Pseudomonadota bacterium]